jgi:transposase
MTIVPDASFVGIDVGKTWLDVARWGQPDVWRVSNDAEGVAELLNRMETWAPHLIVLEATGGYEQGAAQALLLKPWPVAVVNPTRVRALAKATGKLAKTDRIDARLIAEYAGTIQPPGLVPQEAQETRLNGLLIRREQLVEMHAAEQNRLDTVPDSVRRDIREHLDWLSTRIATLELQIQAVLEHLPARQAQAQHLDSIPGVGLITAMTVISEMPELGLLERQQIAALAGLAPFDRESGHKSSAKRIFGGRKRVRRVLYMAALSASKCNPVIRGLFERLMKKGKVFKVAITACMHKLLTIMNALARDQVDWRSPEPNPI